MRGILGSFGRDYSRVVAQSEVIGNWVKSIGFHADEFRRRERLQRRPLAHAETVGTHFGA